MTAPPPPIREPFTLLPCPMHPSTTLGTEGCLEHAIVASDGRIHARELRVYARLPTSGARVSFDAAERGWLRYRRGWCAADASRFTGGSEEPLELAACEARLNSTHLRELAALQTAFAGH